MSAEVLMVMGPPAGGKGTLAAELSEGHIVLNRDKAGGKVSSLVPRMETTLRRGKSVLLDNTFPTAESRRPFIEAAQALGVPVHCHLQDTKKEDCTINAAWRMIDRHQQVFYTAADIKAHEKASKSPNVFPIAVIFKYAKEYEAPLKSEGFASVTKHKFVRRPLGDQYCNSAVIFDADETLRTSTGPKKFPTDPSHVKALPGRREKIATLNGELLLGFSNQSGIAKGDLTEATAQACFAETNKQVGAEIEWYYCPHGVPPSCYCCKPQSGAAVYLVWKYKLNPAKVTYVGDQTKDRTWATRMGFNYVDQAVYFRGS